MSPGGWVPMNGDDDHERIIALEDKVDVLIEKVADMRGSNKVWAIIMATVVSVAFGAAQSWFSRPTSADDVKAAVQELTQELKRINRDAEARQR